MTEAAASSELGASAAPVERPPAVVSSTTETTQTSTKPPNNKKDGVKPEEFSNGSATANENTSADDPAKKNNVVEQAAPKAAPVVSSSKRSRPAYKYDPNKITLRFLFANKDGLTVTVECKPLDTVSEVKGALLSVWPEGKQTTFRQERKRAKLSNQQQAACLFVRKYILYYHGRESSCFFQTGMGGAVSD